MPHEIQRPAQAAAPWLQWRTETGSPPRQRLEYWNDLVCQAVIDVDITTRGQHGDAFKGSIFMRRQLGSRFVAFRSSGHRLDRTRAHTARIDSDSLIVGLQCSGQARIGQGRHELALGQGDIAVVDGTEPFQMEFPAAIERRLVIVPRALLGRAGTLVSRGQGPLRLPASAAIAPAIAPLVRLLADEGVQHDDAMASVLLNHLGELLAMQCGAGQSAEPAAGRNLFEQVLHCIEQRLDAPSLSAPQVAAAAGISVRTLHRLFQRHGQAPMETFEQCVFEKRLERAWRALSSGAAASVTDAALDCGFSDLSHFSRRFAQRFGLAPSALFRGR